MSGSCRLHYWSTDSTLRWHSSSLLLHLLAEWPLTHAPVSGDTDLLLNMVVHIFKSYLYTMNNHTVDVEGNEAVVSTLSADREAPPRVVLWFYLLRAGFTLANYGPLVLAPLSDECNSVCCHPILWPLLCGLMSSGIHQTLCEPVQPAGRLSLAIHLFSCTV